MKRKLLMLLMTFTMSAAMLVGCSKQETTEDDTVTEAERTEADKDDDTSADTTAAAKTLDDYMAEPGVKDAMDADMESAKTAYASTYSDVSYEIDGNTFVYIYVFKDPMPEDTISELQESLDKELQNAIDSQNLIGIMEQQTGVEGVSIQYIYRNPDGTDVFNKIYSK
ncbi:MAG: DUF4854 domain-containing protein [Clostridium sp.]|nr:DUF4854 domain-containing protein [Clostridium sp.]MCM1171598.1 DUF4854 domain-containing protein [Clostridium sp.]MCM1207587.1 DUF4854 domain-containing protein [Ruminococcus sp.]